jgi:hypothetical protein
VYADHGEWLPDDSFLIRQSLAGPLQMHLDGQVTKVFTETFRAPSLEAGDATVFTLAPTQDAHPHLLLWHSQIPGSLLYHPESGEVETLPPNYDRAPDVQWPQGWLLGRHPDKVGTVARRLDPPGGTPITLTGALDNIAFSPAVDRVAFPNHQTDRLELWAFPSWDLLGEWDLASDDRPVWSSWPEWSPDGRMLAITRDASGSRAGAVFIVPNLPPAP